MKQTKVYDHLLNFLFCVRGFLWIISIYPLEYLLFHYFVIIGFWETHNFTATIIALAFAVLMVLFGISRIYKDIITIKNRHISNLIHQQFSIIESRKNEEINLSVKKDCESIDFYWDSYGTTYQDIKSYLLSFVNRDDDFARRLRWSMTKQSVCDKIYEAFRHMNSLRIWPKQRIFSFNYGVPVAFSDVVSIEYDNKSYVTRGNGHITSHHKLSGITSSKISSIRGKSYSTVEFEPDRIFDDYKIYFTIRNELDSFICLNIRNNSVLFHEIKSYLILMTDNDRQFIAFK